MSDLTSLDHIPTPALTAADIAAATRLAEAAGVAHIVRPDLCVETR